MAQDGTRQRHSEERTPTSITISCEGVVDAYRAGNIDRAEAVDQLSTIIANAPGGIGGNPGALQAHLAPLEEWDRERADAAARGSGARQDITQDRDDVGNEYGDREVRERDRRDGDSIFRMGFSRAHDFVTPFNGSRATTPAEAGRAGQWNEVDPADYAWNWKGSDPPGKWKSIEPLTRRTQQLRAIYARDPKQAMASVLEQYDKPVFPQSMWKTVLLNDFLEFEKLHGETFTLESTKADTYSLGDNVEIEILDSGGGAKSRAVSDFGTWTVLWDQYAAAVAYAYPHRRNELDGYRKWIVNYFRWSKRPHIVLDIDRACRRAITGDQTLSLDDKDSLAAFNFRFSDQGVGGEGPIPRSSMYNRRRGTARSASNTSNRDDRTSNEYCKRWNKGLCSNPKCQFVHMCSGCGGDHQRGSCQRIGGTGKARVI
jgi:hypothetical protein